MKKRFKVLLALVMSLTMIFGMAQSVFAQHIYIEDTPVGYTYLFERYGYSVLTAESHSDDIVGYAYADFEDHTIRIKAEPLEADEFGFTHGVNGYVSNRISRGTNAAIIPQATESDDYFTKLLGEPFTVVENELYKSPVVNNNTPSVEPKEENPSMTAEQIAEQRAEEMQKAIEETIAAEEKLPVTEFTSESAVNSMPAAAKSTGAAANLSKITTMQGFSSAVTKLAAAAKASSANRNGVASVTVYTDKPMTFSTDMLDAIYAADVNFSYAFRYEGHIYKITIPRGAKVDLGGSKYEGPLFVGGLLGTTQVIE